MNTFKLKEQIKQELECIDDKYVLEGISRLLHININNDDVYYVSDDLKKKLMRSDKQIDEGNFISNKDLKYQLKKWLKV